MHEMGITQSIMATALDVAAAEGATKITEIKVSVGDLTEVMVDALQFAFEVVKEGTIAEDAKLVVTTVPARSRCLSCGLEFEHGRYDLTCPSCEAYICELLQGRELKVDSIDIDD